jgi:uncharacterized membrane protein
MFNIKNFFNNNISEKDEHFAFLAYIFFLLPAPFSQQSDFIRFHMKQGLILFLLVVILKSLVIAAPGVFGFLNPTILPIWVILFMIGTLHALHGEMEKLPVIGGLLA